MKHRLTFEFTPNEINVLQISLDHLAEELEEVILSEGYNPNEDWRYVNCVNLISVFKKAVIK